MKTDTRAKILKLIEKNGKIRPFELQKALTISAQAIHRHLRSLITQGIVEAKGSAPFTQYALAGVPDLEAASKWLNARRVTQSPSTWVSETREIFSARLSQLKMYIRQGLAKSLLPLVISTVGEIGNNSFDHNLGQWRDVSGCWFESQVTGKHLWIWIADRGQGIFHSLAKVHPELKDEQTALHAAYETIISGRAPEQRGNGLKFVKKNLSTAPGTGVACMSGGARVFYGEQGDRCSAFLDRYFIRVNGTLTLMTWRLQ
jgi:DNA-binding Lrp family transcriptional regulator